MWEIGRQEFRLLIEVVSILIVLNLNALILHGVAYTLNISKK